MCGDGTRGLHDGDRAGTGPVGGSDPQRTGDGFFGWKDKAPFDAIIGTAAAEQVPKPLLEQLKPQGRMILPCGDADRASVSGPRHQGPTRGTLTKAGLARAIRAHDRASAKAGHQIGGLLFPMTIDKELRRQSLLASLSLLNTGTLPRLSVCPMDALEAGFSVLLSWLRVLLASH